MTRRVLFLAYPGIQILDLAGPHEVFVGANQVLDVERRSDPRYDVSVVAECNGPLEAEGGLSLHLSDGLPDPAGPFDTVVIPGGTASRDVSARTVDWVRSAAPNTRRVASVCTGSFITAAAGLCDNKRVTTHWAFAGEFATAFPTVSVEPDSIYVQDGNLWSSAGVTAGIDLALAMVEQDLGSEVSQTIAKHMVVYLRRPGGQTQIASPVWATSTATEPIERARDEIHADPGADLSIARLADRCGLSSRHFTRRFRSEVGEPPARYVERVRVEAARHLLERSGVGLDEVARRCGFGTVETLRRAFHRRLGLSPDSYRRQFLKQPTNKET